MLKDRFQIRTKDAYYYSDNGILICEVNSDIILDIKMAKKLVAERISLCPVKDVPFLLVIRNYLLLDKEAFNYFGTANGVENLNSCAIVIKSPIQRILKNFSLLFYKQTIPFRLFNSTSDAKLWLFKFVLESDQESQIELLSSE